MCNIRNVKIKPFATIILSMLFLFTLQSLQSQQFRTYLEIGGFSTQVSPDSASVKLHNDYQNALLKNDTAQIVNALITLSAVNRSQINYSSAFDNAGAALFLAEESKNVLLLAKANEEFGVLNYLFVRDDFAGLHFKQSHKYYLQAYYQKRIQQKDLYRAYYNLILYNNRMDNFALSSRYIDSCFATIDTSDVYHLYPVYLNEKKALIQNHSGNREAALKLLNTSANTIEQLDGEAAAAKIHKSFLIVLYTSMGNIYKLTERPTLAKTYYKKALATKDYFGEYTFYLSYVYSQYATLLNQLGENELAYKNLVKSKHINDKYLNPRNESNQDFLTIKNRYREELNKKNEELNKKNLELSENKQEILRFRIILSVTILLILIIGLFIRGRIQHFKHQKEKDLIIKQEQHSKELLDQKNKELTSTMLQLIEKEEIINAISDHLDKSSDPKSTKKLLSSIKTQSGNLWEAFNSRFMEQNKDFYEKLQNKAPDLTATDLKVCALIKLNFSGKEMAYLLGISLGSVHVARHRIRKKMNIDRDINLTRMINSI